MVEPTSSAALVLSTSSMGVTHDQLLLMAAALVLAYLATLR